jgi:hypothetical protein
VGEREYALPLLSLEGNCMTEHIKEVSKKTTAKPVKPANPDDRVVKGMFKSYEVPGATIKFPFAKGKQEIKFYTLTDGHIYVIPLSVA